MPTEYEYRWANIGAHRSSGYPNYGVQKKEWGEKRFPGDPGQGKGFLQDYAWYQGNSGGKLKPVKQRKPNEIGLYDLVGNVNEWMHDTSELTSGCQRSGTLIGGDFLDDENWLGIASLPRFVTDIGDGLVMAPIDRERDRQTKLWQWHAEVQVEQGVKLKPQIELVPPKELGVPKLIMNNVELDVTMRVVELRFAAEKLTISGLITGAKWTNGELVIEKNKTKIEPRVISQGEEKWQFNRQGIDFSAEGISPTSYEVELLTWPQGIARGTWGAIFEGSYVMMGMDESTLNGPLSIRSSLYGFWSIGNIKTKDVVLEGMWSRSGGASSEWIAQERSLTWTWRDQRETIESRQDIVISPTQGAIEKVKLIKATFKTADGRIFTVKLDHFSELTPANQFKEQKRIKLITPGFRVMRN